MIGTKLDNGWTIISVYGQEGYATETNAHPRGFVAQHKDGEKAFVKILELTLDPELSGKEALLDLKTRIARFIYEEDLLKRCKEKKIKRVVRHIQSGKIQLGQNQTVEYLMFELAEQDLGKHCGPEAEIDTESVLTILHQICVALEGMHFYSITHQNLIPNAVSVFDDQNAKLGDLSRAHDRSHKKPGQDDSCRDPVYAPLEQLYQMQIPDLKVRQLSADLYFFGSLIAFVFTGVNMTALIHNHLQTEHHFQEWGGTYEDVLPYLFEAWEAALEELALSSDELVSDEICDLVRYLTHPNPLERGFPGKKVKSEGQFGLRRFSSRIDAVKKRYIIEKKRAA